MEKYKLLSQLFDEIMLFMDDENKKKHDKIDKFMDEYNKIISDMENKSYDTFMILLKSMDVSVFEGENQIKILNNDFIININNVHDKKLKYLLLKFYENRKNELLVELEYHINNSFNYIK